MSYRDKSSISILQDKDGQIANGSNQEIPTKQQDLGDLGEMYFSSNFIH